MASQSEIYSVFGEIESIAARMMVERGKATILEVSPMHAKRNKLGQAARMYITISRRNLRDWEELIDALRT